MLRHFCAHSRPNYRATNRPLNSVKDPDHLNTPRSITDQSGNEVWRYDNVEPFGDTPPNENPGGFGVFEQPLRDQGTYFDKETGLLYNWHRYRDPGGGRFIQPDALGLMGGDLSLYVLRRDNPLSYVDANGKVAASGVIGGALSGGARGSSLGIPGFIAGVAIGALLPSMCQVTARDRCERQCDRDYDWDQKQCEWVWKMSGRDPDVLRRCMDRARQIYLDCYRDCAK
jgi:RHS repeat-associated protein